MAIDSVPPDGLDTRSARRSCIAPLTVLTGALVMAAVGSSVLQRASSPVTPPKGPRAQVAVAEAPAEASRSEAALEKPAPEASPVEVPAAETWREATGGPLSRWAWAQIEPPSLTPTPEVTPEPEAQSTEPPRATMVVPLPIPRPPEFRASGGATLSRRAERRMARRELPAAPVPAPQADERSFLEKLFGIEHAPAMAYAALESKPADLVPQRHISPPLAPTKEPSPTAGVAVYNIAARTVTLPSGERLEAHSGLGAGLDDPRMVNLRMRGPTPPGTYDLTEREQLFHGVRAIRLTPVGGSEAVYGRVGLLAHTFMLGPRGDSNGCVSFRDYNRFLQAFLRGEVQRLVVVSGTRDPLPSLAETGRTRMARAGN
ncbi:tlde1 domain-containing protein [Methylobacterium sp. P31]